MYAKIIKHTLCNADKSKKFACLIEQEKIKGVRKHTPLFVKTEWSAVRA